MGWTRFFRRSRWDAERARELEAHLEIETDELIARGVAPDEARWAAQRKLGNPLRIREEIYEMNTLAFVETIWQDLRYAARRLRHDRAFTAVALLSLMLGIGANTAIFQLLDVVRLRSLPVRDPSQLVEVRPAGTQPRPGNVITRYAQLTNPQWERLRADQQAFSSMLAWAPMRLNLASGGEVRHAQAIFVSGDFFEMLGVSASRGRLLGTADDQRGCGSRAAVISDAFWRREYGGAPDIVGRPIRLDHQAFDIVGVTPAGFYGVEVGRQFDVAVPICAAAGAWRRCRPARRQLQLVALHHGTPSSRLVGRTGDRAAAGDLPGPVPGDGVGAPGSGTGRGVPEVPAGGRPARRRLLVAAHEVRGAAVAAPWTVRAGPARGVRQSREPAAGEGGRSHA